MPQTRSTPQHSAQCISYTSLQTRLFELGLPADAADQAEVDHGVENVAVELHTAGAAVRTAGIAIRSAGAAVRRLATHNRLLLGLLVGFGRDGRIVLALRRHRLLRCACL